MTRLKYIDEGTTQGGSPGTEGDVVNIGPEYGEDNKTSVGVGVEFSDLDIGPASAGVGVGVQLNQLVMDFTVSGSHTPTIPAGATTAKAECWGGGGGD